MLYFVYMNSQLCREKRGEGLDGVGRYVIHESYLNGFLGGYCGVPYYVCPDPSLLPSFFLSSFRVEI